MSENEAKGTSVPEKADENPLAQYESIIAPIRDKHGEVAVFKAPKGFPCAIIVVARPLNDTAYQVFSNNLINEKADKHVVSRQFAQACMQYPEPEVAKAILKAYPGLVTTISGRGMQLCGAGAEELGKD